MSSCAVTNEWASKSIGLEVQVRHSVSGGKGNGDSPQNSFAEAQEASCPPQMFLGLKSGGKRYKGVVEAVVAQAGRTFLRNKQWIVSGYYQAKR
jgi:hypothetical protein